MIAIVIVMYQHGLFSCNKFTTTMQEVNNKGETEEVNEGCIGFLLL